jgi:thioredoxin 2
MLLECRQCGATNRVPSERVDRAARCGRCKTPLTIDAPVPVDSVEAFRDLVERSPLPILVDFWAPWCGPCRMIAPELQKLARERAGRAVVVKVNTDELPQLGATYGIRGIPTLVLFRGGKEASRVSGAMNAPAIARAVGL